MAIRHSVRAAPGRLWQAFKRELLRDRHVILYQQEGDAARVSRLPSRGRGG